jgi:ABC-type molybdate transport system substrate-binding protein
MPSGRLLLVVIFMGVLAMPAFASDLVLLHAAGSLRGALTEVAEAFERSAFEKSSTFKVQARFGASGLLRDEIAAGAKVEVFASANMEHPQALANAGRSGPVVLFARNRLCALVRPGLSVTRETLLERMLDPQVKLATSTPKADPAGDYAFAAFAKAEAVRPDARTALESKALQLTGGATSAAPPGGRNPYGWHIAEGRADIFLAYCTAARDATKEIPGLQTIALPEAFAVSADYGLTVIADASANGYQFAMFILSSEGQRILAAHGFSAPTLPQ